MKLAGALLLFVSACALAQQPAVIRTETKLVLVDAVVTDKKGGYVRDLAAKDFKIWEDGKEQTIQSLSLESTAAATGQQRVDYVVVALDFGGMGAGDQLRARQAAQRFIDANASPNRLLAVANLFENGVDIVQGFTDNAGRLKDAVNAAKVAVISTVNAPAGRGRNAQTANDPSARNPVLTMRALTSLVTDLNQAPGRKSVVLLTGNLAVPSSQRAALTDLIAASNRSNVALYPVNVRDFSPQAFDASNSAVNLGSASGGRGRRGGGGGNGIGAGGGDTDSLPNADPEADDQQFLLAMASGTGGFLVRNSGELPEGMQRIGEEQDLYYVIGYTPPDSKEGACHALKVKVDRGGLTVRARADYCTEKQHDIVAVNATTKDLEKRAAGSQAPAIGASMRLPFFYVAPGVARVHAVLEIQPDAIKLEKKSDRLHAEINVLGSASAADGSIGARFSDTLTIDIPEADFEKWRSAPLHYEKQFKIAPGEYNLTVVFSAGGESFGKLQQPLVVEAYQAGQFAMSGLALGKEIRKTGDQSASLFDDRTPLVTSGVELIPTGSAVFGKGDRAFCYFEVYKAAEADLPAVIMRILDPKTGHAVWDGGNAKLELPTNGKTTVPVGLTMATTELPPGSYELEITATSGANSVRRTAAFEIK